MEEMVISLKTSRVDDYAVPGSLCQPAREIGDSNNLAIRLSWLFGLQL
jgi:hypothetical protein